MTFTVVENVRGFFGSRPPLVVFMIFLGSMAVGLITFAYIVRVKDMPNSDIAEDWNTFLERVSGLHFCLTGEVGWTNASQAERETGYREQLKMAASRMFRDLDGGSGGSTMTTSPSAPTVPAVSSLMNVSVIMDLEIAATAGLQRIATRHNHTYITATLQGGQLGRRGDRQDMEANLTMVLPPLGNRTFHCGRGQCYRVSACVTMTALRHFFPHTRRPDMEETCPREPDVGGENHVHVEVIPNYVRCANTSYLLLQHRYDPTLTAVTTMQDRSAINLHLMHSSYFLFVMVVTLFCYAIIKGRPAKVKVVYTQCSSDKHAPNQV